MVASKKLKKKTKESPPNEENNENLAHISPETKKAMEVHNRAEMLGKLRKKIKTNQDQSLLTDGNYYSKFYQDGREKVSSRSDLFVKEKDGIISECDLNKEGKPMTREYRVLLVK